MFFKFSATGDLEALKKKVFVLKEGAEYRVKINFKVSIFALCVLWSEIFPIINDWLFWIMTLAHFLFAFFLSIQSAAPGMLSFQLWVLHVETHSSLRLFHSHDILNSPRITKGKGVPPSVDSYYLSWGTHCFLIVPFGCILPYLDILHTSSQISHKLCKWQLVSECMSRSRDVNKTFNRKKNRDLLRKCGVC